MTAIVSLSGAGWTFISADSARFDLVQQRLLKPVKKIWFFNNILVSKAGAGSVADPSMPDLTKRLMPKTIFDGELEKMAMSVDPEIQKRHQDACLKNGRIYQPVRYVLIAGTVHDGEGRIKRIDMPDVYTSEPTKYGITIAGSGEQELICGAVKHFESLLQQDSGKIDLAHWAGLVIEEASRRRPQEISFPIDCIILRRNGRRKISEQQFGSIPTAFASNTFVVDLSTMPLPED